MMAQSLNGKIVLITGASAGIGAACAELFAEAGARLLLLARRQDRLEKLAASLRSQHHIEVLPLQCDVRSLDQVRRVFETLPAEWQAIDVLINNAGLARGLNPIDQGNIQDWEEMIDTNVKGLLYVTRQVLPGMIQRQRGTIVNIGSIAGREVYPQGNVYCATKHAVRALSQAIRIDTNGKNIRVCNVDPGLVETEFSLVRFRGDAERAKKVYEGYTPLSPRDVAEVVLFCVQRPPHVTIADVLVLPTDQATTTIVHKTDSSSQ